MPLVLLFGGMFTRWVSGSPLATLHYIGTRGIVPATWLMILLFSLSYIVAGLSLGTALGSRFCGRGERKYRGAMWFFICMFLGYAWYPLFFLARLFLVTLILSVLSLFASICATICFGGVSRLAFCLAILYDVWLIYLLLLNVQVFFMV